jgi:hypothetical protein
VCLKENGCGPASQVSRLEAMGYLWGSHLLEEKEKNIGIKA